MKKFLMSVALMATVAVGYLMTDSNKSEAELTDLATANIEALAQHITIGRYVQRVVMAIVSVYIFGMTSTWKWKVALFTIDFL